MLSPLRELAKAIELLFLPSEDENEPSEDWIGDSPARKTKDHPKLDEGDIPPIAERFIEQVASGVGELNGKIQTTPVRPDTVGYVLRLFESIIGVLLLRMFVQAAIKNNPAAPRLASAFRTTLTSAFSIDGVADGFPRGWFVRAWADDKTRPMLDRFVRDPDRLSRLAALVAAGAVLTQRTDLRESDAGMDEVLAGFGLVVGDASLADLIRLRPGVRQHIRRLAVHGYGLLDESALVEALSPIAVNTLPEVAAAIRWQPILALLNAEKAGVTDLGPLEAAVKTSDPQSFETYQAVRIRRQPPIAFMRVVAGCAVCSGCNTRPPAEIVARVRSRRSGCETCPGFRCGRILVPLAVDSSVTMKILGQFAPELNRGLS
jgi:hypothetical protein